MSDKKGGAVGNDKKTGDLTSGNNFCESNTIESTPRFQSKSQEYPVKITLNSEIILDCNNDEIKSEIIKANTFTNPLYISNEKNHRSNWNTDATIETYRVENGRLVLPRGFMRELVALLKEQEIAFKLEDERLSCPCEFPDKLEGISLRDYQQRCVEAAMKYDQGTICAPTGSGKSLLALEIIRRRKEKALVIVHRADLAAQWRQVIKTRLGIEVGFIGAGAWIEGEQITVALIQTLHSQPERVKKLDVGLVLTDETHHVPAKTFFEVLEWLPARCRFGLSATLQREDGLMPMIFRGLGPILANIDRGEVEETGATVPALVEVTKTGLKFNSDSWQEFVADLCTCVERNLFIFELASKLTTSTLILTDRVAHSEDLSGFFERRGIPNTLAHGTVKNRPELIDKIKGSQLTIATTSLVGEGIDVSHWETLIMACPISSEIKLLQAIGRIIRSAPGKERGIVYDLVDDCGFSGASFKKRLAIYRKHNLRVNFKKTI